MNFESIMLFSLIIILLGFKPILINDLTSTVIGKIIFILLIIYFSSKSTTLGLLFTIIIVLSNEILVKENFSEKINVISKNNDDDKLNTPEIDKLTIEENVKSKESKTIPVNKIQNMDNVISSNTQDKINVSGYTPKNSNLSFNNLPKQ